MDHKISVLITAKNKVTAVLEKIGSGFKKLVGGLKAAAIGVGAAVASITAVAVKGLNAYRQDELAVRRLMAAHEAFGENADELIAKERAIASAIQNETAVGDELTLARMGQLRMLGVTADKLEEAAKGVVGLTNAGMADQTAVRAMAAAMQGNFTLLQRYIPTLRDCTDATEKAALVNGFVTASYEQQKATMDTTTGRWNELQGRIGDTWEVVGQMVSESTDLSNVMKWLSDKVLELSTRMSEWCASGGIAKAIRGLSVFGVTVRAIIEQAGINLLRFGETGAYYLSYPFRYVGSVVGTWANTLLEGVMLGVDYVKYAISKLKGESLPPPSTTSFSAALDEMGRAVLGKGALMEEQRADHLANQEHYASLIEASEKRHSDRLTAIDEKYLARRKASAEKAKKVAPAPSVLPEVEGAEMMSLHEKQEAEFEKRLASDKAKYEELKKLIAKGEAEIGEIKEEAAAKRLELQERNLDKDIRARVDAEKRQRRADKKLAREQHKADILEKRLADGQAIGTRNQRWLDAFNARKAEMTAAAEKAKKAQDLLAAQLQEARALNGNIQTLSQHLQANLRVN